MKKPQPINLSPQDIAEGLLAGLEVLEGAPTERILKNAGKIERAKFILRGIVAGEFAVVPNKSTTPPPAASPSRRGKK